MDKFLNDKTIAEEAIRMLQKHIRVDTTNPPGNEIKLAEIIKKDFDDFISENKIDWITTKILMTGDIRANLIIDITGSDPSNNPSWGFASHMDVVPAEPDYWDHPPFSGELVQDEHDKYIWGRDSNSLRRIGERSVFHLIHCFRINMSAGEGVRTLEDTKSQDLKSCAFDHFATPSRIGF